ncbi:hypothetical protein M436DRAFT_79516 [Aureobasidium namibiae CBS 147.97]|uniref:Uncharacterized protein n=1 Tax=Aureobasidium namibiae CBS 147.97 TaxID=1043004 RepID=A0A074WSU5_9PEZI|nr:uncharacterized protein M436DRAFT_79516 [Aureobasidium namibiae CBS 147.97]KEQ76265.1 hypothetical protein M436DRAFT_79516 [Aureobasidium namibiae CBS 147.97]
MASEESGPLGPAHKRLTAEDLDAFQTNFVSLEEVGFDKEIEAWDSSLNEWTARLASPTWKA